MPTVFWSSILTKKRVVITGMSISTPLGDTLDSFIDQLLAGNSAITRWESIATDQIYAKVGGDLGSYPINQKIKSYESQIPDRVYARLKKLGAKFPKQVGVSIQLAVEAFRDSGLLGTYSEIDNNIATIVSGHNLNQNHLFKNHNTFNDEPDFIDGLFALNSLDTHHLGTVTETLQLKGPAYSVGAACASGNAALKCGWDEIQLRDVPVAAIVGPFLDFSPLALHGMSLIGAISYQSFNDVPEKASRPYDTRREGFVPSHGAAVVILEELEHALNRNAKIYAEVLGASTSSDGSHLPQPSQDGQVRLMKRLINLCNIRPEDIDFISAHATSTPLGDLTELRSIKEVFGAHAYRLKLNAPKSMLGHTCWSSALVELVAGVLQMQRGTLHPSINIDQLDPEVDLDICRGTRVNHQIGLMMNNSFGFGGLNSISIIKRFEDVR